MYFQPYQSLKVSFDQLLVDQDPMTKKITGFYLTNKYYSWTDSKKTLLLSCCHILLISFLLYDALRNYQ